MSIILSYLTRFQKRIVYLSSIFENYGSIFIDQGSEYSKKTLKKKRKSLINPKKRNINKFEINDLDNGKDEENEISLKNIPNELSLSTINSQTSFNLTLSQPSRKEVSNIDYFSILPNEIIFHIFIFLNAHDIARVSQVNRRFYFLTKNNSLWKGN